MLGAYVLAAFTGDLVSKRSTLKKEFTMMRELGAAGKDRAATLALPATELLTLLVAAQCAAVATASVIAWSSGYTAFIRVTARLRRVCCAICRMS